MDCADLAGRFTNVQERCSAVRDGRFGFLVGCCVGGCCSELFQGLGLSIYDAIPQSYGDNLPGAANVTVEYRTVDPANNNTTFSSLSYWDTGYGDLVDVAFPGAASNLAELSLVPEPGWRVRLNGFDIAGWLQTDHPNQTLRILDENFNSMIDYSPVVIHGAGPTHDSYAPNLTSAGRLRIQWGPDWNVGIDNVSFSQVAVPEPSSLLLAV